jgi:hypothetical protein
MMLVGPPVLFLGFTGAFLLLVFFSLALAINIKRGNSIQCNCFGSTSSRPISKYDLIRNAAIAAVGIVGIVSSYQNRSGVLITETIPIKSLFVIAVSIAYLGLALSVREIAELLK